jgi:tyrosine-protein phosphatase YwqE
LIFSPPLFLHTWSSASKDRIAAVHFNSTLKEDKILYNNKNTWGKWIDLRYCLEVLHFISIWNNKKSKTLQTINNTRYVFLVFQHNQC